MLGAATGPEVMGKRTRQSELNHETVRHYLETGHWIKVNKSVFQRRAIYSGIPEYYRPRYFKCRDCGVAQTWTAKQQQWWYEEAGGTLESTAVRCRRCRQLRKTAATPQGGE